MSERVVYSGGELRTESGGSIPPSALTGGADQAAAIADTAALTSAAITGGESPTEAEHNAVVADVAAIHATQLLILAALRSYGVIASS